MATVRETIVAEAASIQAKINGLQAAFDADKAALEADLLAVNANLVTFEQWLDTEINQFKDKTAGFFNRFGV
jgi:hypothetical protein